jgi:signal transduction histidine kinase
LSKKPTPKKSSKLWLCFSIIIFATICGVFLAFIALWAALYALHIVQVDPKFGHTSISFFLFGSVLLGSAVSVFVGKLIIRPVQNISNAFGELSRGNFDIRVPTDEKIDEIREMARQFNAMVHDLSHIETLRSDFVSNVSHEFKTPIASIEGYAELLQNHDFSAEKRDYYIEKILDNARKLSNLSSSILMLSKLENQETVLNKKEYRLDEQLREAVLLFENKWAAKNIEFDMDLPNQIYYGSEELLGQVWMNILDNAIKYSPDGGIIHILMQHGEGIIRVTITDHGGGMTEEVQKHIFEKFFQGDSSRKAEGNGLGLTMVKRILDLCSASILVESEPGKGSTFTVRLKM